MKRRSQPSWDLNLWFKERKYFKSDVSGVRPRRPAILLFLTVLFLNINVFPRNWYRRYLITEVGSHRLQQSHKKYCSLSKVMSASDYSLLHSLGSAFH